MLPIRISGAVAEFRKKLWHSFRVFDRRFVSAIQSIIQLHSIHYWDDAHPNPLAWSDFGSGTVTCIQSAGD